MVAADYSSYPLPGVDSRLIARPLQAGVNTTGKIGIAITTKDRWDDLAMVLERLEAYGVFGTETIVMDDGSELPCTTEFDDLSLLRFERSAFSMGYIVQRNRLATLLSTPSI